MDVAVEKTEGRRRSKMGESPGKSSLSRRLRDSFRGKRSSAQGDVSPDASPVKGTPTASPLTKKLHHQESVLIKVKPGSTFTPLASVVVERSEKADPTLATLGQLRHAIKTSSETSVKKLVRDNHWSLGARIRSELWCELAGRGKSLEDASLFYRAQRGEMERNAPGVVPTPTFLAGDVPEEIQRELRPEGRDALHRLLSVMEHSRPDFVTSPVLCPLAVLLLHYASEESAYAALAALLARGQRFILTTNIATQASMRTLLVLIRKHAKPVDQLLRSLRGSEEDEAVVEVLWQWHAWIFRDLPLPHAVRVTDCFLWEGHKVLFRVALALLERWRKAEGPRLRARTNLSAEEISEDIAAFARTLPATPAKLLRVAFGIRNLQISTIAALQERHELRIRQGKPGFSYSLYRCKSSRVEASSSAAAVLGAFPSVRLESDVLEEHGAAAELLQMLPPRLQLLQPTRVFSAKKDGTSFTRLWQALDGWEGAEETLILIQTYDGEVFGGFASRAWNERLGKGGRRFFGTGESFLFRLRPGPAVKWAWVGLDGTQTGHSQDLFQAADASSLILGGGSGEGLSVREELVCGLTEPCDTFANESLAKDKAFEIQHFEAFAFAEPREE